VSIPPVIFCPGVPVTTTPLTTSVNVPESLAPGCAAMAAASFDMALLCTSSGW
jgi:hypothetical protein